MKILDITEVKLEWLDLTTMTQHIPKPYVVPPGTIGTTTVLRYIATTLGTLKLHAEDIEDAPWRVLMGMGFEMAAAQLYPDMKWPAKVLSNHGVAGHPDALSWISGTYGDVVLDDALVIDEFKYTAKSLRDKDAPKQTPVKKFKDIRSDWMWMNQMMSYLAMSMEYYPSYAFDQPLVGRFHVMWAMGTYEKYTLDERYLRYLIEYERAEVERAWAMIQKNKEGARKWITSLR